MLHKRVARSIVSMLRATFGGGEGSRIINLTDVNRAALLVWMNVVALECGANFFLVTQAALKNLRVINEK